MKFSKVNVMPNEDENILIVIRVFESNNFDAFVIIDFQIKRNRIQFKAHLILHQKNKYENRTFCAVIIAEFIQKTSKPERHTINRNDRIE